MLPLGLSMLWEPLEPGAALEQRFGFASLEAVQDWTTKALEQRWGLVAGGCSRVVISDQNAILWFETDRGGVVVKWSREGGRFTRLAASTHLLRTLAEQGVPVASPITTVDGLERVVMDGPACALSIAVLPELTGDWLDVEDHAAVRSAGAALARLHHALGASSGEGDAAPPVEELRPQIEQWLAAQEDGLAPDASRRLGTLLAQAPDLDDRVQLLHNDFRAANLLTRDSRVVGILDFDEVGVGHRVGDLARASVYLGTRFTHWRPTPPAARQALRQGYESVRPLTHTEDPWLEVLALWQGLMAIPGRDDPDAWASAL